MPELTPIAILNDSLSPVHTIVANLRDSQMEEIEIQENWYPISLPGIERKVYVGAYKYRARIGKYTKCPIEKDQILRYSKGSLLPSLVDSLLGQRLVELFGIEWKEPDDLEIGVRVQESEGAVIDYNVGEDTLLKVFSDARYVGGNFAKHITFDETGLYILPTKENLATMIKRVETKAADVNDSQFRYRYGEHRWGVPYKKAFEAARNLAKRLDPPESLCEEHFQEIYENAWNKILEKRLPNILKQMRHSLSTIIKRPERFSGYFSTTPSLEIELILDRVSTGTISLGDFKQDLAEIVVLNGMIDSITQYRRLTDRYLEIEKMQYEIGGLGSKIRELVSEMAAKITSISELKGEVAREKLEADKRMRKRLGFYDPSNLETFIREVKPDEIPDPDPDEDDIPF
ncbi:MAG: hypothetical protein ABIB79_02020 [archaeon]